jgi:VWFA-related protein
VRSRRGRGNRSSLADPLTGSFGLTEHLDVNEHLEVGTGAFSIPFGRSLHRPSLTLIAPIWAVSLIAVSWIGEGRAAAQTTRDPRPGVLLTGRPEPSPDTVPSEGGLVQVEVVVTDPRHSPVTGLPAEAFRLEEDGERQRVMSFQAVDLAESAAPELATSGPARVSTNAVGANAPLSSTFVIVFDDGHLGPAGARQAREVSKQFITEHTRPGDQVVLIVPGEGLVRSVVMPGGRAPLAALTSSLRGRREAAPILTDHESFRIVEAGDSAVEERAAERFRDTGTLPSEEREPIEYVRSEARQVLEGARSRRRRLLEALASALDALPGGGTRKSVLLVSEGFIYEPDDRLTYDVIAASQRANAAVYFLDVRGLTVGGRPDGFGQRTARVSTSRGDSAGAEVLATITGGYAVENVSDLTEELDRLSREASHHYLLGYHPRGERRDGRLRRIRVAVDRPGVVVRSRTGYYDAPDTRPGLDREVSTLDARLRDALRSSSPIRQIPLRLTALALASDEDGRVQVAIVSEASAKGMRLARLPDGSPVARLDAALQIRHAQPQASQVASLERLVIRVPRGVPAEEAWLPFHRAFTLPPGRVQVKLAVRDRGSGAIGTVVHDLEVPDVARSRISSPILSDVPSGEGVRPPRIVARRSFAGGSVLYCYFEVYPGPGISAGDPDQAGAAYEVVDRKGRVRLRAALPLPVPRDGGGLGRLVEIPLARIGPGEYELVLDLAGEVTGGTAELRESFSVTKPRRFSDDLYRGALGAYLEGDFQSAVTTLLQWPAREVRAAAERLPQNADRLQETALLLHTDLAMVLRRHGRIRSAEAHLAIGRALLESAALPDLHREWLLALAYAHQAQSRPAEALAFYTECARVFPEVGEARLGAGTLHERNAFLPDGFGRNLNLPPRLAAQAAERSYREALRVEPSLIEARLRLARVFQRTDRTDEAVPQLSLVVESGQDASLSALAHLFWGEILESRDDVDGAIEHYRAALAADGDLQVAALALAQTLHRRDGRQAAVDALAPALGAGGGTSPWLDYCQGPQGLSTSSLHELRARLRAAAGDPR